MSSHAPSAQPLYKFPTESIHDASVVSQDIDLAEFADNVVKQTLHL